MFARSLLAAITLRSSVSCELTACSPRKAFIEPLIKSLRDAALTLGDEIGSFRAFQVTRDGRRDSERRLLYRQLGVDLVECDKNGRKEVRSHALNSP